MSQQTERIKIFENHTLFNRNWRIFFNQVFVALIGFLVMAVELLMFGLWGLSLGHLCLYRWCNHLLGFDNDCDDDKLHIFISGLSKVKVIENGGFVNIKWVRVMRGIVLFLFVFSIIVLYIPAGLIWFLSLGHLYLYRLVNKLYEYILNFVVPD